MKLILAKIANIEKPLLLAAERSREAIVKLLLDKGAMVDSKDTGFDGQTPFKLCFIGRTFAICDPASL